MKLNTGNWTLDNLELFRVMTASPDGKIANPHFNREKMLEFVQIAHQNEVQLLLFPELCMTLYSPQDYFRNRDLQQATVTSIRLFLNETKNIDTVVVIGAPYFTNNGIYNCEFFCQNGKILGMVPKLFLPSGAEYYECRDFITAFNTLGVMPGDDKPMVVDFLGQSQIPFGADLVFGNMVSLGICEDSFRPNHPYIEQALSGSLILLNPSASSELVGKTLYLQQQFGGLSAQLTAAYVYCAANNCESNDSFVFSGRQFIVEDGTLQRHCNTDFDGITHLIHDIDVGALRTKRQATTNFGQGRCRQIPVTFRKTSTTKTFIKPLRVPSVPEDPAARKIRMEEIVNIILAGLVAKFRKTAENGFTKWVIGLSGGQDSMFVYMLAIEAAKRVHEKYGYVICIQLVTMPGYGTSMKKHGSLWRAKQTMKVFGHPVQVWDIRKSCDEQLLLLGNDLGNPNSHQLENVQPLVRTGLLLRHGMVLSTTHVTDILMGNYTHGDQIAAFAPMSGLDKVAVPHAMLYMRDEAKFGYNKAQKAIITRIAEASPSPDLAKLTADGDSSQDTKSLVGEFDLISHYHYYLFRLGFSIQKLLFYASVAYPELDAVTLIKELQRVVEKTNGNRFKALVNIAGTMIGPLSAAARGAMRIPSDADVAIWTTKLSEFLGEQIGPNV